MIRARLKVINRRGLHARAAAKFVATVEQFDSQVKLGKDRRMVDGCKIMQVMSLAAGQGVELELEAEGREAQELVNALKALFRSRFDEED